MRPLNPLQLRPLQILKKRVSAPSFQELLFGANFKEEQSQGIAVSNSKNAHYIDNTLKWSTIHPIHFAHQLTLYHQLIYQSITEADIITYKVEHHPSFHFLSAFLSAFLPPLI